MSAPRRLSCPGPESGQGGSLFREFLAVADPPTSVDFAVWSGYSCSGTIAASRVMRRFPFHHAEKRDPIFFPEKPEEFAADVLEIGPGRGDFLFSTAEANPDQAFVAIELKKRRFRKLCSRVEKRGLNNVLVIYGDGRIIVPRFYPEETFQSIFVLFPDPWPKRRHEPMRLLSTEFLDAMALRLRVGGELVVATDDAKYRDWVVKQATRVALLEPTDMHESGRTPTAEWVPTFYEQRWREEGRTIVYFSYRRVMQMTSETTQVDRGSGS